MWSETRDVKKTLDNRRMKQPNSSHAQISSRLSSLVSRPVYMRIGFSSKSSMASTASMARDTRKACVAKAYTSYNLHPTAIHKLLITDCAGREAPAHASARPCITPRKRLEGAQRGGGMPLNFSAWKARQKALLTTADS